MTRLPRVAVLLAVLAGLGAAIALAQRPAQPAIVLTFGGLEWAPERQAYANVSFAGWVYQSTQHPDMRLLELRDIPAMPSPQRVPGGFAAFVRAPLVARTMQARDPHSGDWVDHGLMMMVVDVNTSDQGVVALVLYRHGKQVDEPIGLPPLRDEW